MIYISETDMLRIC